MRDVTRANKHHEDDTYYKLHKSRPTYISPNAVVARMFCAISAFGERRRL
jgi:hypothetical protein